MTEIEWGWALLVRLPCGHRAEVDAAWIKPDGTPSGVLQCVEAKCRRQAPGVRLKGWTTWVRR